MSRLLRNELASTSGKTMGGASGSVDANPHNPEACTALAGQWVTTGRNG
jgi:hypothetical protein